MDEMHSPVLSLSTAGAGGSMSTTFEGKFQCPKCFQRYVVPETDLFTVRDHVRKHVGMEKTTVAYVKKRLT
jgi:hypothetical protein